ncbi:MAG: MarR family winged helix-turn-helix transcriptional regulator [Oscillospiraceae bacterium]|jgi:DNA-binding MarR family transcriptional regulator
MKNYGITNLLLAIQHMEKLYESMIKQIGKHHHLSLMEMTILSFLYNNPGKDTASEIVEIRMLQKGHVSQGVSSLIQKELLTRQQDQHDRRVIHLSLTPKTSSIVQEIEKKKEEFMAIVYEGFSPEEQEQYLQFVRRIVENTTNARTRKRI